MGGYGSTRWNGHTRKPTAESGLTLSVVSLYRKVIPPTCWQSRGGWHGSIVWRDTHTGKQTAAVDGWLNGQPDGLTLTLDYTVTPFGGISTAVHETFRLTSTPCYFGGARWWFVCPCQRRVGCLYLPGGARYFRCRHCYGLTYQSAQAAHRYDRMGGELGALMREYRSAVNSARADRRRYG